jgi:RNA polymerase sigma-70 factor (ECF subfamily)
VRSSSPERGGAHAEVPDLRDRNDRVLVARVAEADEDAFAELFRRYGSAAFGLALRMLGDRELAEDVLQEVFLSVWRRAWAYDASRGTVRAWLLTQVHHRAVDVIRREEAARRRSGVNLAPVADEQLEEIVEESWLAARRAQVLAALAGLSPEQRRVIELAYYDGLTQQEVAARAGIPLGTVKSRTLAALRRLRATLLGREDG